MLYAWAKRSESVVAPRVPNELDFVIHICCLNSITDFSAQVPFGVQDCSLAIGLEAMGFLLLLLWCNVSQEKSLVVVLIGSEMYHSITTAISYNFTSFTISRTATCEQLSYIRKQ